LALVRQLVEMHGGRIAVESDGVNRGSMFTVTFPVVADEALTPVAARPPLAHGTLDAWRILIVDDEGDWRDLLGTVLGASGAEVFAAESATAAMASLSRPSGTAPNVLLSDLGLPGEDGFQFMRRVRALDGPVARIAALAVTTYTGAVHERRALEAGFDRFLSKPVSPEDVVGAVLALVERHRLPRSLRRRTVT
jgi:CheY-like chemotaxis protein